MQDPRARLLVPADGLHQRVAVVSDRARGDLRASALGAHVPHSRGGGGKGQQHSLRPLRRCLDRQRVAHSVDGRADARRRRLGQHVQPLRPDLALRRLQGVGLWARRRRARIAALPGAGLVAGKRSVRPLLPALARNGGDRIDVRKTYKQYVGGEFVRSESGRAYRPDGAVNVPRGSRKDLRDAVRAARTAFAGWSGRTAMNRGQILYRAAEMLDGRRTQFVELLGGGARARIELDEAVEVLVWYAGWTDKLA